MSGGAPTWNQPDSGSTSCALCSCWCSWWLSRSRTAEKEDTSKWTQHSRKRDQIPEAKSGSLIRQQWRDRNVCLQRIKHNSHHLHVQFPWPWLHKLLWTSTTWPSPKFGLGECMLNCTELKTWTCSPYKKRPKSVQMNTALKSSFISVNLLKHTFTHEGLYKDTIPRFVLNSHDFQESTLLMIYT